MALSAAAVFKGPGEIAVMVLEVSRRVFKRPFQWAEFAEQAWFITSVTLMPTILVSIPFGAVISLQVGNLTGQLGAQSFAGATAVLAVVREAAPIAAALIQMAISRAREFEADRGGAKISGDPQALATALDKIHRYAQGIPFPTAEEHPATAQMMIMNPLSGGGMAKLFSTHPATEERIARLMEMARTGRFD